MSRIGFLQWCEVDPISWTESLDNNITYSVRISGSISVGIYHRHCEVQPDGQVNVEKLNDKLKDAAAANMLGYETS